MEYSSGTDENHGAHLKPLHNTLYDGELRCKEKYTTQ